MASSNKVVTYDEDEQLLYIGNTGKTIDIFGFNPTVKRASPYIVLWDTGSSTSNEKRVRFLQSSELLRIQSMDDSGNADLTNEITVDRTANSFDTLTLNGTLGLTVEGLITAKAGTLGSPSITFAGSSLGLKKMVGVDGLSIEVEDLSQVATEAFFVKWGSTGQQWGSPQNAATIAPDFLVNHNFDRGGALMTRSLFLTDSGDTEEIAFRSTDGTPESPTRPGFSHPLAFIYWQPLDNSGSGIFDPGPIYGEQAQISGGGNAGSVKDDGDGTDKTVDMSSALFADTAVQGTSGDYAVYVAASDQVLGTLQVKDTDYSVDTTPASEAITFLAGRGPSGGTRIKIYQRSSLTGSGPFYGRSAQIAGWGSEAQTVDNRGGGMVFYSTKNGEVALRQRFWLSNLGYVVFGGRASYEDGTTAEYPDNARVYADASGVMGAHEYSNTEGWGNVSIIASDYADAPAIAIRKYDATETKGMDIAYEHATDLIRFERVGSPNELMGTVGVNTGAWKLGYWDSSDEPSLHVLPIENAVNSIQITGNTFGDPPAITVVGETNIDLQLNADGTGIVKTPNFFLINGTTATADASLEVAGTDGAFLLPRLSQANINALTPTAGMLAYHSGDAVVELYNGSAWVRSPGTPTFKSYSYKSRSGTTGDHYLAGFYEAPTGAAILNQGAATQTLGTANNPYGAHVFVVTEANGTVSGGSTGDADIRISGTTITEAGGRDASPANVQLIPAVTSSGTNTYYETTEKWVGQVTITIATTGDRTSFAQNLNYGFTKYEDFGNRAMTLTDLEFVGLANKADTSLNLIAIHHQASNWTYNNGAFDPNNPTYNANVIADMITDYVTEDSSAAGINLAYKRSELSLAINGNNGEGIILLIKDNASGGDGIAYLDAHIGAII